MRASSAFPSVKADGLIEAIEAGVDPIDHAEFPSVKADGLIEADAGKNGVQIAAELGFPSVKADGLIEARPILRRCRRRTPCFRR